MLTIKDLLPEWARIAEPLPLPTTAELNSADLPLFVEPNDSALLHVKDLLSYEAWLYLMHAHEREVSYEYTQGESDAKAHMTRLILLLAPGLGKDASFLEPAVRARFRWVQQRLFDDSLPKPYYQNAAEVILEDARFQAEMAAVHAAMTGDVPSAQQVTLSTSIAARSKWGKAVRHPEFGTWFVQELLHRPVEEMEAYLTVEWRVGIEGNANPSGDFRKVLIPEDLLYICKILKAAAAANPSHKPALKQARNWFMQGVDTFLAAGVAEESAQPTLELRLRQIALRELYDGLPIRDDGRAAKLAREHGHNSATSGYQLARAYRKIKGLNAITSIEGPAIKPMLEDLLVVQSLLGKGKNLVLENQILTLELKK